MNETSGNRSSVLSRWRERIIERFSGHPFPPPEPPPLVLTNARGELTLEGVAQLDQSQFTQLVASFFTAVGFRAVPAEDGSPLIRLFRSETTEAFGVVLAEWHLGDVQAAGIRELHGVLTAEKLSEGYIVARAGFSADARAVDTARTIMLLDGREFLVRFNRIARPTRAAILAPLTKPAETIRPAA